MIQTKLDKMSAVMWSCVVLQQVACRFDYRPADVFLLDGSVKFSVQVSTEIEKAQEVANFITSWINDVAPVKIRWSTGALLYIVEVEFDFNA